MLRWIALAFVGFAPTAALAGVIPWEYRTDLVAVGGMDPTTNSNLVQLGSISIHDSEVGQLNANLPGSAWGWRTVPLGSVTLAGEESPDVTWRLPPGTFRLLLGLTDKASGHSATLNFAGHAWITGEQVLWQDNFGFNRIDIRNLHVQAEIDSVTAQSVLLGGNQYDVNVDVINHPNGTAYLEANVRAGPINEAPEPMTMISAFIGIGIVGAGIVSIRGSRRR